MRTPSRRYVIIERIHLPTDGCNKMWISYIMNELLFTNIDEEIEASDHSNHGDGKLDEFQTGKRMVFCDHVAALDSQHNGLWSHGPWDQVPGFHKSNGCILREDQTVTQQHQEPRQAHHVNFDGWRRVNHDWFLGYSWNPAWRRGAPAAYTV